MTEIMMALGDFRFSIETAAYQSIERSAAYRWPANERIGKNPLLQFTGPETEVINLAGTIYPTYKGGIGQVVAMRAMAGRGVPLLLVDGRGVVHGYWVIKSVNENGELFFANGIPRKIEFRLELAFYGLDAPGRV